MDDVQEGRHMAMLICSLNAVLQAPILCGRFLATRHPDISNPEGMPNADCLTVRSGKWRLIF
jgi:hypothetical protein